MITCKKIPLILFGMLILMKTYAQDSLYVHNFNLGAVNLLDSPLKSAQDLNIENLLKYDVDRLLEPYLTEAGLSSTAEPYENWDGLAGHIGGHYLSALAIHYAATGNSDCKTRLDYMITELKACQDANGDGYLGGVPASSTVWSQLQDGDFTGYYNAWVPWYNVHKTYAGLRDAWLYAGNATAKEMFLALCDWGIAIIADLSDTQIQTMLDVEFGGMNEVYADAYQMTGESKYLDAAKRFTHDVLFDAMVAGTDNLDNMHANTQIPKVLGFERVAQVDSQATTNDYQEASEFFWNTVVNTRSLALGGNSRAEHFPSATACDDYISSREGPESCNTYNMLKLSEQLFSKKPEAKYADFYERALFNHILSTQHPEHGGYVYFTPARPRHYRVYSDANEAMWCCVGSGMENHGKYGEFIYSHFGEDSLFVNLFIASELNWEAKGIQIKQETNFPDADTTQLTISTSSSTDFKLLLRVPSWVQADEYAIFINQDSVEQSFTPGTYASLERTWSDGDVVKIKMPMHLTYEELPNVPEYIALLYGPVLLSTKTGTDNLDGLVADDSRWGHIAYGALEAINEAPALIGTRDSLTYKVKRISTDSLKFEISDVFVDQSRMDTLVLEPFFRVHDARYMMYWLALTDEEYDEVIAAIQEEEEAAIELDNRTVDEVATGEQQPEADHNMSSSNSYSGTHNDVAWRDARDGGYFSYLMNTEGKTNLAVRATYWGYEVGDRTFDIKVDGEVIATENTSGQWNVNDFVDVEYPIATDLLTGKEQITVGFYARANNYAGGVFYLRLVESDETQIKNISGSTNQAYYYMQNNTFMMHFNSSYKQGQFKLYNTVGQLVQSGILEGETQSIPTEQLNKGIYIFRYQLDGKTYSDKVFIY